MGASYTPGLGARSLPMGFPAIRPRRLRQSQALRSLVRESHLAPSMLIYPMFFHEGIDSARPIGTMPGVSQQPLSAAAGLAKDIAKRGIKGVILFGLPKKKDAKGSSALDPNGPVPTAVKAMKDAAPELVVMTDICVDEYTDHGHCGVLHDDGHGGQEVDNDAT